MDFTALTLLIETVAAGSLAEAARRLRLSPMKASRLVSALEQELGVRLLHRTTRALSLTDEGAAFLPHARALVEEQAAALASVRGRGAGPVGLLRISTSLAFGRQVVAPFAVEFMRTYREVRIDLQLTDSVIDIVAEGIDVAIRIAELRDNSLIARRIADNPRHLVASGAYVEQFGAPASLAELVRHECLATSAASHWSFLVGHERRSVQVKGRFTANSIDAIDQACRGGLGIANLSAWNVGPLIANGTLREIVLADATPEPLDIWAVYASRQMVPAKVRVFIDELTARLRDGRAGA